MVYFDSQEVLQVAKACDSDITANIQRFKFKCESKDLKYKSILNKGNV